MICCKKQRTVDNERLAFSDRLFLSFPQLHQQFQEFINLLLGSQIVARMGALLSANADRNDVASKSEGILIVLIIP